MATCQTFDNSALKFIQSALPCLYPDICKCIFKFIIDDFWEMCIDNMVRSGNAYSPFSEWYSFSWKLEYSREWGTCAVCIILHALGNKYNKDHLIFYSEFTLNKFIRMILTKTLEDFIYGWCHFNCSPLGGLSMAQVNEANISDIIIQKYIDSAEKLSQIISKY